MIRSSALLIAAALALLAAGVFASSLELVYVSIGVSILAAVLLSAGVILRRGEIFGAAPEAERPPLLGGVACRAPFARSSAFRSPRAAAPLRPSATAGTAVTSAAGRLVAAPGRSASGAAPKISPRRRITPADSRTAARMLTPIET